MTTQLTQRVMRRVYVIYALRQIFKPAFVKCYILLLLLWQATTHVSLGDVVHNAEASGVFALHRFSASAFSNTETVVQVALISGAVLAVWLLRDVASRARPLFGRREHHHGNTVSA